MNLSHLSAVALCITVAACATARDGALGKFHKYDANEYSLTVELLRLAQNISPQCGNLALTLRATEDLDSKIDFFLTYAQGRPYNNRVVDLANDLKSLSQDTQTRHTMSEFFCQERAKNIVRASELLRSASGEKPE